MLDLGVGSVEEFKEDVSDGNLFQGAPEGFRAEIEEELVALARVNGAGAHGAQGLGMCGNHAHRVPGQPARLDIGQQLAGCGIEGR
jgi:hypothetical protein